MCIADALDIPMQSNLTTSALETWSRTSGSPRSLDSVKRLLDIPDKSLPDALSQPSSPGPPTEHMASLLGEPLLPWPTEQAEQSQSTAPSISGSDHYSVFSNKSLASMASGLSGRSSYTSASASGVSRRRGKRRYDRNDSQDSALSGKRFPCTFCAKAFSDSYNWKRHEATHVPFVDLWICMPDNVAIDEDDECLFCFAPNVDDAHLYSHNISSCQRKPIEERSFKRKDQLKQHIELCHLSKAQAADSHMLNKFLDHWHREADLSWRNDECKDALWCGFCCTKSSTWKERQKHVEDHFRNGRNISAWHSYQKFVEYLKDRWDERHAGTFQRYSDYVDYLISELQANR